MSDVHEVVPPRRAETLELDDLPSEKRTRLLVSLAEDGLGQSIRVPMIVAKGRRPGPVFGLTAAVHGNELNGIPVIHRLLERIDLSKLRGTVAAVVVVNVPGFLLHQRPFVDGTDLNHIMPGKQGGNVANSYAFRLVDRIISKFDYLVDLHTASFGRINSYYIRADLRQPVTRRMASLLRPRIILNDPPSDYTLRGAAEELKIPAVTVELRDPQRFQKDVIRSTLAGVRACLGEFGMLAKTKPAPGPTPIVCSDSKWLYTDHGGLLEVLPDVREVVNEGDVVGRLTNIFGDVIREYRATETGVIIGKSSNPVGHTGARIVHVGRAETDSEILAGIAGGGEVSA